MKLHKNTSISHNTLKQEGTLWHKKNKKHKNKEQKTTNQMNTKENQI